ncbi:MAG: hypothetical protein ACRDRJ_43860 [Streptosporangiaceae bacterium]
MLNRNGRAPADADVSYAILTALNGSDDYNWTVSNGTAAGQVPAGGRGDRDHHADSGCPPGAASPRHRR